MEILNLYSGEAFQMGRGKNWRVIHPDMGAKQLTLNHGLHAPDQEFTQHVHGETEDMIVALEGGGSLRQGDRYTPIKAGEAVFVPGGEVHGTVNTSGKEARLISFQSPPDRALYRGERDGSADQIPRPRAGHRSAVQIIYMAKGGPVFGRPGDWRDVISPGRGSKHLGLDYIRLEESEGFDHQPGETEQIYVILSGKAEVKSSDRSWALKAHDVIFLSPGETFSLTNKGKNPLALIRCYAVR
jgi:mannose-6-phosphate isomerase-like protein (cupin superfamily)